MKKTKEKNFVSAVIYVRNAEDLIGNFVSMIYKELKVNFENFEIICVDDCSKDSSIDRIREVVKTFEHSNVSVVHMSFMQGRELCMTAGVDLAIGDFIFEFDKTTMDYDPDTIMQIYNMALEGNDIVSATSSVRKKFTSAFFYKIFNCFASNQYPIKTETFRILSRRAVNRITAMNKTIPYRKALYANCGLKYENFCYQSVAENAGENRKLEQQERHARRILAVDSLILFTDAAFEFSILMTILMMGVMVLVAVYAIFIFLTGTPIEGWTTTILFLAFAFFGLFGILTIVIKYLSTIVELIFKKQNYTFESIEKLTK